MTSPDDMYKTAVSHQFACTQCSTEFEIGEEKTACRKCGKTFEGVRDGDTFEVWVGDRAVAEWTLEIEYQCHLCGEFFDESEKVNDHYERMHYSEVITEAENDG